MERRRFSQAMASEWQTAFIFSHKMSWCALLTAVKNYNKSLEKLTFSLRLRPRPNVQDFHMFKTFIFVLEAPRDEDPGLENYITDLAGLENIVIFSKISKNILYF